MVNANVILGSTFQAKQAHAKSVWSMAVISALMTALGNAKFAPTPPSRPTWKVNAKNAMPKTVYPALLEIRISAMYASTVEQTCTTKLESACAPNIRPSILMGFAILAMFSTAVFAHRSTRILARSALTPMLWSSSMERRPAHAFKRVINPT